MEDWQGCLSPECQEALVRAWELVQGRGGAVVTVEDFLLALLDTVAGITDFLRRRGVDLDELIRTIQCEQPVVARVGSDGTLSTQLAGWLARSREIHPQPWLGWPELMQVLVRDSERLQAKAYVAVLEVVGDWPVGQAEPELAVTGTATLPLVIADTAWARLAEQLTVMLAAGGDVLLWLRGSHGSGKSSWLRYLCQCDDIRAVAADPAGEAGAEPEAENGDGLRTSLILDDTSPAELLEQIKTPGSAAGRLLSRWQGPVVLAAPEEREEPWAELARRLERIPEVVDMPACGRVQRLAILAVHQPVIEKTWNVQVSSEALHYAACCSDERVASPGDMLRWVRQAAARLDLRARRGPAEGIARRGWQETLRRQQLVALARQEAVADSLFCGQEPEVSAAHTAWLQRRQAGRLRRLAAEDLQRELELRLAADAAPVHYEHHHRQQHGDSVSAGPGNLHS